jgi:hypothetical protein
MNDYRISRNGIKQLTEKESKSIQRRQKLALLYKAKEKIEDYQNEVFGIIDNKGLKNDDDKIKLETSLKVLEYIIPKKKSSEVTVITKKIEDIIQESIQEAEIISEETSKPDDKGI